MFAIAYATRPPLNVFVEPWNPHVALPFFVLFLVQVWLLATGSRWQAVGVVLTGSFLVHLHIGYAPLVAITALFGLVLAVGRHPARDHGLATVAKGGGTRAWCSSSCGHRRSSSSSPAARETSARWSGTSPTGSTRSRGGIGRLGLFAAQFRVPPPWLGRDGVAKSGPPAQWFPPASRGCSSPRRWSVSACSPRTAAVTAPPTAWWCSDWSAALASIVALSRVSSSCSRTSRSGGSPSPPSSWDQWPGRWADGCGSNSTPAARRVCAGVLLAGIAVSFGARTYDVIEQPPSITTLTAIEPDARQVVEQLELAGLPLPARSGARGRFDAGRPRSGGVRCARS